MQDAPRPPAPSGAEDIASTGSEEDDEGLDKGKARWQIGSSSLGLLEQVYAVEPFPGRQPAKTHRALWEQTAPCLHRPHMFVHFPIP